MTAPSDAETRFPLWVNRCVLLRPSAALCPLLFQQRSNWCIAAKDATCQSATTQRKKKDRLAAVSPELDHVFLLALMAEANTKLERLLAQSADCAFHLFGNVNNPRLGFRVRLQGAMFVFAPRFAFHNSFRCLCHLTTLFVIGTNARSTDKKNDCQLIIFVLCYAVTLTKRATYVLIEKRI